MIPDPKNPYISTEEIILDILAQKPRLPVKDLFEFYSGRVPKSMSIQGFYKAIRGLVKKRVLVKEGHLVSMDAAWIHNLINFGEILRQTYMDTETTVANILVKEGERKTFTFDTPMAMDNFWTHALIVVAHYYYEHAHADKHVYCYNHHSWFHLIKTAQEQSLASAYREGGMNLYVVSASNKFLDTLAELFMESKDFHYKLTKPIGILVQNYYVTVMGDYLFETKLPKYIYEMMEDVYHRVQNISEFNAQEMLDLIHLPGKTELTISKDKKRAEQVRQAIKANF